MFHRALTRRTVAIGGVAIGLIVLGVGVAGRAQAVRVINMLDRCDPASFNAAFGAGTCIFEHPGVSLDSFLNVLGSAGQIGSWNFSPRRINLQAGQPHQAHNRGGEVHTFTEVAEFGGGFVTELNDLTGNPVPAPECLNFAAIEFIPAGASGAQEVDAPGEHKYMCCIHPWMRATVTVR